MPYALDKQRYGDPGVRLLLTIYSIFFVGVMYSGEYDVSLSDVCDVIQRNF